MKQPNLLGDGFNNKRWFIYRECKILVEDLLFDDLSRQVSIPHLGLRFNSIDPCKAKYAAIKAADQFVCKLRGENYNPHKCYGQEMVAFHGETLNFIHL